MLRRKALEGGALALALALGGASCGWVLGLDEFVDAAAGGAGGEAPTSSTTSGGAQRCSQGARDCVGNTPRECADDVWVTQAPCSGGAPVCAGGACVVCVEEQRGCDGNRPRRCEEGAWVLETTCADPEPGCHEGTCVPASCAGGGPGAGTNCGLEGDRDCCASALVPGGKFNRSNDASYPATVRDFHLDVYEVTVGRFRAFVEAGKGTKADPPMEGDGAHPTLAGSGWRYEWNDSLEASTTLLRAALKCPYTWNWTDGVGPNEQRPIGCISWYEAFAFCAWDGGRLPTEAEWEHAAAGGSQQRQWPWGSEFDATRTSYRCLGDGDPSCTPNDLRPVGTYSPAGDGRWGHADLAGNAAEMMLDWHSTNPNYPLPCDDCAQLTAGTNKILKGGSAWAPTTSGLMSASRTWENPTTRGVILGVRCVRRF
ncbi:uncharacterized protein CMC5_039070 [Chondromyces crocatus]|uniref:Sulfatase-modifying factor enzyme-like domain-containing protein n=2 Tax=Chondromyces crocatus TaxID=52 RepID=A0A0K1EFV6_CHOCO|nr:SUMF1/EgtB/PvdO family nonheme iron enzyme [Chondromyces crocatus]AKT39756.1 uncharacterized protein CMC5_039070 [Chondromyces crocatus]